MINGLTISRIKIRIRKHFLTKSFKNGNTFQICFKPACR